MKTSNFIVSIIWQKAKELSDVLGIENSSASNERLDDFVDEIDTPYDNCVSK